MEPVPHLVRAPARPVAVPHPDTDGASAPARRSVDQRLLDAVVSVADGLELESTLRRIVRAAADLTGAPYAALGVLGPNGLHQAFLYTGIPPEMAARIGHLPAGHGVLGHITRVGRAVRVKDIGQHAESVGFPANHPPMKAFLGVPVGIGGRVMGNLYLADKDGGFTAEDEDVVVALAAAAAVAVENAQLYEAAMGREQWVRAAQEVTTAMLSGADEEEALSLVATRAREAASAVAAGLVLPGWEAGQWVLEVADGQGAEALTGLVMPPEGRAVSAIDSGEGLLVEDLSREPRLLVPQLRGFGPALYAPLVAGEQKMGTLVLLRERGQPPFTAVDLATAQTFAGQAALTLQLAESRRRAGDAELLEERQRIARDLHDLVIQELFAMGMRLFRLRDSLSPSAASQIDSSLESLDRVVRQIRSTIRALRDPEEKLGLVDRLHGEAARARSALGFEPEVQFAAAGDPDESVPLDIADDMVAVVREGLSNAARHARPAHVTVRVTVTPDVVTVEVRDDGRGLNPEASRRSGLENLVARARRHGGGCTAASSPHGGTALRWYAPLTMEPVNA